MSDWAVIMNHFEDAATELKAKAGVDHTLLKLKINVLATIDWGVETLVEQLGEEFNDHDYCGFGLGQCEHCEGNSYD